MGKEEIERFLSSLAVERNVAAATQNQALTAILFLYREVLQLPMEEKIEADWTCSNNRNPGMHVCADIWKRSEPELAALDRKPSEQITEQMAFTPYPFEDVGAMIRDSNPDLYLFSSDYPHLEGGRNPLGRFTTSLEGFGDDVRDKFFSANMARLVAPA